VTWLGVYLHEKDDKCIQILIGKPSSRSKNINNIDLKETKTAPVGVTEFV
jgi:hypothetical protein